MIVLDNEAVQALLVDHHPKRRSMLAVIERALHRRRSDRHRRLENSDVVSVPTVVRVAAGWSRGESRLVNHLAVRDVPLEGLENAAASLVSVRRTAGPGSLAPADAHLGAALGSGDIVFTSDVSDVEWMASQRNLEINVLRVWPARTE